MNTSVPVSKLMSSPVLHVKPDDKLSTVKEIFDQHHIHHVPVVESEEVVGIISQTDLLHFLRGLTCSEYEKYMNEIRLKNYSAKEIMSTKVSTIEPDDTINDALKIFSNNNFHALPVVKDKELVGMLTTRDIIKALFSESEATVTKQ